MDSYTTIQGQSSAEIIEKKSRFIADLAPVTTEEEALAFLESVRTKHRMAKHHAFAYILREGARVRSSDDGEPSRTASLPLLDAINHAGLTDVIMVVTRYFGGTLLGAGGLVRVYTQAALAAIAEAVFVTISLCVDIDFHLSYSAYNQAQHLIKLEGAKIVDVEFTDAVRLRLRVLATKQGLIEKLRPLLSGDEAVSISESYFTAF